MRITLINASPKMNNSTSGSFLNMFKSNFENTADVVEMNLRIPMLTEEQKTILSNSDKIVFAFPLYVDGIPGHLLSCLVEMEQKKLVKSGSFVYGIVNCGFYEGIQTETALRVLENWCDKVGVLWGGGLGIGGGGAMAYMPETLGTNGPMATIGKEIKTLAEHLKAGYIGENHYAQLAIPRFFYKLGGEMGWRNMARTNGLTKSDLDRKL